MDDSPDKLRRNVILISIIIISTLMFDFTIAESASILGIVKIGNISPLNLWLSLLILLIYFFLRYIYSEQVATDRKAMKNDMEELRIKAAHQLIHKQIGKYLKTGNQPSCLVKPLPSLSLREKYLRNEIPKLKVTFAELDDYSNGSINVKYTKTVIHPEKQTTIESLSDLAFKIPRAQQAIILIKTAARTATISKSSVNFIVPLILSFISFVACIHTIGKLINCKIDFDLVIQHITPYLH